MALIWDDLIPLAGLEALPGYVSNWSDAVVMWRGQTLVVSEFNNAGGWLNKIHAFNPNSAAWLEISDPIETEYPYMGWNGSIDSVGGRLFVSRFSADETQAVIRTSTDGVSWDTAIEGYIVNRDAGGIQEKNGQYWILADTFGAVEDKHLLTWDTSGVTGVIDLNTIGITQYPELRLTVNEQGVFISCLVAETYVAVGETLTQRGKVFSVANGQLVEIYSQEHIAPKAGTSVSYQQATEVTALSWKGRLFVQASPASNYPRFREWDGSAWAEEVSTEGMLPETYGSYHFGVNAFSISGEIVANESYVTGQNNLWSINPKTGAFTKIVDINTTVPDGFADTGAHISTGGGNPFFQFYRDEENSEYILAWAPYPVVYEVAHAFDEAWTVGYPLPVSAAEAEDELFAVSAERTVLVVEQANATDRLMPGVYVPPAESVANASDEVWVGPVAVLVSETATASDELTVSAIGGAIVTEPASATDEVWQSSTVMAESVANASDDVATGYHLMAESEATVSAEVTASVTAYALAESQASAEDELWAVVQSLQIVTVVADAIDHVLAPDQYAMAMVMNVETGAPYLYDNFPIMAAAQSGESVFAIGPDGIYRLDGDNDAGFDIQARIELSGLMLGKPDNRGQLSRSLERKRVEAFWLDCESQTVMAVGVYSYDQGKEPYRYKAMRPLDDTGNMRVNVGKGLKSKWWGVTISNTYGGDFTLLDASADVLQTARRR